MGNTTSNQKSITVGNCGYGYQCPILGESKYGFHVRGDTPGSHSFFNAIKVGCIPVIISDLFELVVLPFKSKIDLGKISISFSEAEFLEDPDMCVDILRNIDERHVIKAVPAASYLNI